MTYALLSTQQEPIKKNLLKLAGLQEVQALCLSKADGFDLIDSLQYDGLVLGSEYWQGVSHQLQSPTLVDTIKKIGNHYQGTNTFIQAFQQCLADKKVDLTNKKVLILGNDNKAQCIKQALDGIEVYCVDITESLGSISYVDVFARHLDAQVIINTTPMGKPDTLENAPIAIDLFYQCELVIDCISNPVLTLLGLQAQEQQIDRIIGVEIEARQALAILDFFERPSQISSSQLIIQQLTHQCNIVLIGMPSAGKTTIGQALASLMNKEFIDLDDVVIRKSQIAIPEIFARSGEAGFRKIESMVSLELAKQTNTIIGTGGGTIKNKANMDYLRLNGLVFFIDRDLDKLISNDPNRPLSKNPEAIKELHQQRYPLYQAYSNVVVYNNDSLQSCIDDILASYQQIIINALNLSD